jgi:transcriptional regulator with XRE-family HTH domain
MATARAEVRTSTHARFAHRPQTTANRRFNVGCEHVAIMAKVRQPALAAEARLLARRQLATVGDAIRAGRRRRGWTQAELGTKAGVSRMLVSRLERALSGGVTLDGLQRVVLALGTQLRLEVARDRLEEPADAGHLAVQELIARLLKEAGFRTTVELPTRPAEPWRSGDVVGVDDRLARLVIVECWNTFGDLGAAARSSSRKQGDGEALAIARWGERDSTVHVVWVIRHTARNRALLARYPEFFASRFPGSSVRWVRALTEGLDPPEASGIVWCDAGATVVFAWRRTRARVP